MAEAALNPRTTPVSAPGPSTAAAARQPWAQRLRIDNLGTIIIVVVMTLVIVLNAVSLAAYFIFREDAAVAAAAGQAADQIIAIRRLVDRAAPEDRLQIIRRLNSPAMAMAVTGRPIVAQSDDQLSSRVVLRRLQREFPPGTEINVDSRIDLGSDPTAAFPSDEEIARHMRGEDDAARASGLTREQRRDQRIERMMNGPQLPLPGPEAVIRLSVRVADGAWFNARVSLALNERTSRTQPIITLSIVSLVLAVLALWGVRRATKPLALFASAAERLGMDVNAPPLDEGGPGEVRRAARAFNTMQTRLKRFIQDRTQMLAAISHDLRTPITRMKLRAEFVDDDEQREKMLKDLGEMEAMIATTLAFARDDAANEPAQRLDVAALTAQLVADQRAAGLDASYGGPTALTFTGRPLALKRALSNLIDNAVKYGKRARVTLAAKPEEIEIVIDDDGPGIPEPDRERVFAPFFRLEASRSRETGGTGLGLTITRNAIRSMGGDVDLANRVDADGHVDGLRARVSLPTASSASFPAE
ncbi:MAG: ATP-binding protein [Rhodospirillaceae bacterium]|nr:ATP-binding protein [Rhodospirillaceae bacterium]